MSRPRSDEQILAKLTEEAQARWVPAEQSEERARENEEKLFARLDELERLAPANQRPRVPAREGRFWGPVAVITAVAAGAVFLARPHTEETAVSEPGLPIVTAPVPAPNTELSPAAAPAPTPSERAALEGVTRGGVLRVEGETAQARMLSLRDGQTIEARGGDAVFHAPGRADWFLEGGSEVRAVRAGAQGGIILALAVGAVEAQVVPVTAGEAFAVDVGGVRVAVHGTHLRVSRKERGGDHVVVDLTEGVILVGAPPKAGSTVGQLVNAPAHVEFSISDLDRTLRIDHDPAHVRLAVDPSSLLHAEAQEAEIPTSATKPVPVAPVSPAPPPASPPPAPTPTAPTSATVVAAGASPALVEAVRACADETLPDTSGAATISTVLTIPVNADGISRVATFAPPTKPELQSCIGRVVYTMKWDEAQRIPIEIRR
jgi:hypothetical protein